MVIDNRPIRPEVMDFARAMEIVLRKNDHKGGWDKDTLPWLSAKFIEEVGEVAVECRRTLWTGTDDVLLGRPDYDRMMNELVDVANVAMMLYDRMRQLKER